MTRPPEQLVPSLVSALGSLPGPRRHLDLYYLRTEPRLCRAVFPWASDPGLKAYVEDMIVVCTEDIDKATLAVPDATATTGKEPATTSTGDSSERDATHPKSDSCLSVPTFALEASLYTVPGRGQSLLYISKVDTTGLSSSPSPARAITTTFLRHFPHSRVHIFARAQSQYLFPGSADNKRKRILDDKALCAWWRRTIDISGPTHARWLLAGYSELEARQLLPASVLSPPTRGGDDARTTKWEYGHPYPAGGHLGDLIPAFSDDPKSRFLTSLTSSALPPSGEEGDYDDAFHALGTMPALSAQPRRDLLEADRKRERARLDNVGVDEFWEGMGWRQECCAGQLAGFFVIEPGEEEEEEEKKKPHAAPPPSSSSSSPSTSSTSSIGPPRAHSTALPHGAYVNFWSALHNVDYSSLEKAAKAHARWREGVEGLIGQEKWIEVHGEVVVEGAAAPSGELKRPLVEEKKEEPKPVVNVLAPRKKPKVAVA
jgi:regulator of Ty1 transposition protein 109